MLNAMEDWDSRNKGILRFLFSYSGDFCGKELRKQKSANISLSKLFLFNLSICPLGKECFALFCFSVLQKLHIYLSKKANVKRHKMQPSLFQASKRARGYNSSSNSALSSWELDSDTSSQLQAFLPEEKISSS